MRTTIMAMAAMLVSSTAFAQTPPPPSVPIADPTSFLTASELKAAIDKAEHDLRPGQAVIAQPLLKSGIFVAQLEYRRAVTPPMVHPTVAEFLTIVAGSGTFTVGGTLVDGKPNGPNIVGTAVTGGETRPVHVGDSVLVPPNTPHAFASVEGRLVVLTTKLPVPAPAH